MVVMSERSTSRPKREANDAHAFSSPSKKNRTPSASGAITPHLVTPSSARKARGSLSSRVEDERQPTARRLPFGRTASDTVTTVEPAVRKIYSLVNSRTGSLGGNGAGGAIYGELTSGSMQKMVNLMKTHTDFGPDSRFIDVGCGLGKPNLHVATDPGVEFSYGIEHERVRWLLGMSNLDAVLGEVEKQLQQGTDESNDQNKIGTRCTFAYADIKEARTFDPFTHVYMFDIGFPPALFYDIAEIFNRSLSPFLICYHGPRLMVDDYGFHVELIIQTNTSMHGSSESHMGYIYKRVSYGSNRSRSKTSRPISGLPSDVPCDPLFAGPWKAIRKGFQSLRKEVKETVLKENDSGRPKRNRIQTKSEV